MKDGCKVCADLRRAFDGPDEFCSDEWPAEGVIGSASCPGHDALIRYVLGNKEAGATVTPLFAKDTETGPSFNFRHSNVGSNRHPCPHAEITFDDGHSSYSHGMRLARDKDEPQTTGCSRILDPDWVDLDVVRSWIDHCLTQHGAACRNPLNIQHVSPAWVIDTADNCLVAGHTAEEYVTLSYRWGSTTNHQTTSRLLQSLQKPGALSESSRLDMPPTIRHAMRLIQALGERYLWADAICIVQDDANHRTEQIHLMGAIYASAKFTIVATEGCADDGILGLRGISPPRLLRQDVIPVFAGEKATSTNRYCYFPESVGPWDRSYFTRGWTFQEYHLSKRRLEFNCRQAQWHCTCANEWFEALIHWAGGEELPDDGWNIASELVRRWPNFQALTGLGNLYCDRKFTFPEDVFLGISGILTVASRPFGGFLFGLPETIFDLSLTWSSGGEITRRRESKRGTSSSHGLRMPSWSWAGWDGVYPSFECGENLFVQGHHGSEGTKATPVTTWFTHETPSGVSKRRISSTWLRIRENRKSLESNPPDGWVREEFDPFSCSSASGVDLYCPRGPAQYIYSHPAIPGEKFWLPIPFAAEGGSTSPLTFPQTPYISCRTKRGWFGARLLEAFDRLPGSSQIDGVLLNRSGTPCGGLKINRKDDLVQLEGAATGSPLQVELVAICRTEKWGRIGECLDEYCQRRKTYYCGFEDVGGNYFKVKNTEYMSQTGSDETSIYGAYVESPSPPPVAWPDVSSEGSSEEAELWEVELEGEEELEGRAELEEQCWNYEVYNVLWVEWENGVAYRRASGWVDRGQWERHDLEDVDLVLG